MPPGVKVPPHVPLQALAVLQKVSTTHPSATSQHPALPVDPGGVAHCPVESQTSPGWRVPLTCAQLA